MSIAITREISPAINECELTHLAREPLDLATARAQQRSHGYTRRGVYQQESSEILQEVFGDIH